ncbi:MAG TPA: isoprenylcysteine carboxylmethyltransferase family protein [Candidatus Binatia bacterium]|nr:isoprenylcysteine carboxylmethyltransferase family protein [Candidatus Binatia bacterium]
MPDVVRRFLRRDVDAFLAAHGLGRRDVRSWVCHPGGPKVLAALRDALELPEPALARAIASLGRCWNVRVIVVPGARAVTAGPYRLVRHPSYAAVVLEGLALPLVAGAWRTAVGFSVLNAALLRVRIRCEEDALARHCPDAERLGRRPRFLPVPFAPSR